MLIRTSGGLAGATPKIGRSLRTVPDWIDQAIALTTWTVSDSAQITGNPAVIGSCGSACDSSAVEQRSTPEAVPNPVLGSWCHNSDILPKLALVHSFFSSCGGLRFLRMDSPRISMRWALCTKRSRMPSAMVGSPICSCQRETGNCEVRIVERVW
jgi:hypothetical protein